MQNFMIHELDESQCPYQDEEKQLKEDIRWKEIELRFEEQIGEMQRFRDEIKSEMKMFQSEIEKKMKRIEKIAKQRQSITEDTEEESANADESEYEILDDIVASAKSAWASLADYKQRIDDSN